MYFPNVIREIDTYKINKHIDGFIKITKITLMVL